MVKPITDRDANVGSVFFVLEIEEVRKPTQALIATVTVPGRDGTLTRRWLLPYGVLSTEMEKDVNAWVQHTVQAALIRWMGAQGVLPAL